MTGRAELVTWCRILGVGPACAKPCDDCRRDSALNARMPDEIRVTVAAARAELGLSPQPGRDHPADPNSQGAPDVTDQPTPEQLGQFAAKLVREAYRIVCLCGSTRFRDYFTAINRELTLAGQIVLAPGVFGHADGIEVSDGEKAALDALHLSKIDLADEVFVVNPAGYIGSSTANEIAYATKTGKPVRYLEDPK